MGRPKKDCWSHVTKVENGKKWICNYCKGEFGGGASRIEAHLGLEGKRGGIKGCNDYPGNEGVNNNLASTSSNPPQAQAVINSTIYSTHDQGALEVIDTQTSNLVNHQNNLEITNLSEDTVNVGALEGIDTHTSNLVNHQNNLEITNLSEATGANSGGCNRSVCESEINQLKQLVLDLECEENDIAKQLQCLESRGKKRKPEVDEWLEDLQEIKESASDINNLNDNIQKLKRHKDEKPLTLSTEYVGRELDFNIKKVLKLVEDDQVFVIGIYGMGGVGKTLLATLVENEVKRKSTFKDVFWVTVSDNTNISKLQHDIAKRIGVNLDEDDERIRAYNLSSALEKKEKSVLILDDVWKYIDLEKVGIHPKVNGIKVILTTRLEHVCHQMDCEPNHMIQIVPLHTNGEDWELFQVNLGHNGAHVTLSPEIEKTARDIVDMCEGLPLGIRVMARAMKGIDDIHQWKHAFSKLKKLEMGQEVEEEVFKVLKRSYDNLMEKDLQNCFLYCALLLYIDHEEFDKDDLIMELVDNGLINGNMCLEEIFDEGNTILNKLEAHSLMSFDEFYRYIDIDDDEVNTTKETHVLTHPLVRSMACYILKESQRNVMVKLTEIPLSHGWVIDLEFVHIQRCGIEEISEDLSPNCPKLSTLIINNVSISHLSKSFFKYMNSLSILDLSYNRKLESLPKSITNLRSLVSLILKGCDSLKHVPPLGELQALSRLVISHTSIEEAPQGLEKLINLKWLDLSQNESLEMESVSFSSYLTKLQYLDLRNTPAVIMVEDIQRMKMLECFGGAIDCKHYNQFMQKNLDMSFGLIKTYHLILENACGESDWIHSINLKSFFPGDSKNRCIEFQDCDSFTFTHILHKDHTRLHIYKNNHWVWLCDALSYSTSSSVRRIDINECHELESLFCLFGSCSFCTNIHNLEDLILRHLESLTVICKEVVDVGQSLSRNDMFSSLKNFDIYNCHLIEKLLTPQLVQQLQNLETITVDSCGSMKEIFAMSNNDDNGNSIITLPRLTRLHLCNLPKLKIVCNGSIHCGSSPEVSIDECPSLERHPTIKIGDYF